MGCGSSVPAPGAPVSPAAPPGNGSVAMPKAISARLSVQLPQTQENASRRLALLLSAEEAFWADEAFHDMARNGKPPHDARVLELLLDDAADARLRKAGVAVYLADAVAEWGDELLEPAYSLPALGAVFGLMASIMPKVQKQQVNRQNCKLLQETVRSAALVLTVVLRRCSAIELKQQDSHWRIKLVELTKILLATRALLCNYCHEHAWVLMMASAKMDKARFEALHYSLELVVQQLVGAMSSDQWSAPITDFTDYMERFASKVAELTGKRVLRDALSVLLAAPEACEHVGAILRLDGSYVHSALKAALPIMDQQAAAVAQAAHQNQLIDKRLRNEARAAEAQAQFAALKQAASKPKTHSHRTKAERDAANDAMLISASPADADDEAGANIDKAVQGEGGNTEPGAENESAQGAGAAPVDGEGKVLGSLEPVASLRDLASSISAKTNRGEKGKTAASAAQADEKATAAADEKPAPAALPLPVVVPSERPAEHLITDPSEPAAATAFSGRFVPPKDLQTLPPIAGASKSPKAVDGLQSEALSPTPDSDVKKEKKSKKKKKKEKDQEGEEEQGKKTKKKKKKGLKKTAKGDTELIAPAEAAPERPKSSLPPI